MGDFLRDSSVATRRPLNVRCDPYGESLKMKSVISLSYTSFVACVEGPGIGNECQQDLSTIIGYSGLRPSDVAHRRNQASAPIDPGT